MTNGLITEALIDTARERLASRPLNETLRELSEREPELCYAVGRFAVNAAGEFDGTPSEVHEFAYRAVWQGVLLALDAYRLAHFRLWRETELGSLLQRLDPSLAEPSPGLSKPPPDEHRGPADAEEAAP